MSKRIDRVTDIHIETYRTTEENRDRARQIDKQLFIRQTECDLSVKD